MEAVKIAPMVEGQRATVLALFDGWPAAQESLAGWRPGRSETFVATTTGIVAGMAEGAFDSDFSGRGAPAECGLPHAYLSYIAVHPGQRRRGVGSALVRALARSAAAGGCTFLAARPAEHDDDLAGRVVFFYACGLRVLTPGRKLMGAPVGDVARGPVRVDDSRPGPTGD